MTSNAHPEYGYIETEFQKEIRKLNYQEFCEKTNICDNVRDNHRKAWLSINMQPPVLTAERVNTFTKHVYDRLDRVHAWNESAELANLKWKSTVAPSDRSGVRIKRVNVNTIHRQDTQVECVLNDDIEMIRSINDSSIPEPNINASTEGHTKMVSSIQARTPEINVPVGLSSLLTNDGPRIELTLHSDDELVPEAESSSDSIITPPSASSPEVVDFEAADSPPKKRKVSNLPMSRSRPRSLIRTKIIWNEDDQYLKSMTSPSTAFKEYITPLSSASVGSPDEFILKIPQGYHHEYLYRLNIECTHRRATADARTRSKATVNCQEQTDLQRILALNGNRPHHVTLFGKRPEKVFQIKCSDWKGVQVLLEIVKNFTHSSRIVEPPSAAIACNALYHFFVKASQFTHVHIQCEEWTSESNLNPKSKSIRKRVGPPIDPFHLTKFSSKRLRPN